MPTDSALSDLDATAARAAIETGELSAADLLEHHLGVIERLNPSLAAITSLDIDAARAAATSIDDRRHRGLPLGALAGLPMTVKDSFDVEGLRTSAGMLEGSHLAVRDAPTVTRLRAADAILLGKTNLPPFLDDHQSSNADFGITRNPWDLDRTPGGSSGGSAAAIAAGLVAGELGSDLNGSIRVPAAWCGVFGHRPSHGILSKRGHLPWPTAGLLHPPQSTAGPIARSARDLELFFASMIVEGEAPAWQLRLPASRVDTLSGLRVGLWLDDEAAPIDAETREALNAFATRLEGAGCRVTLLERPPVSGAESLALNDRLVAVEIAHSLDDATWAATTDPLLRQSARDASHALEEQLQVTRDWAAVFHTVDIVLCPAVPTVAPPLSSVPRRERLLDLDGALVPAHATVSAWSGLLNIGRGPVTVVPVGLGSRSGLPIAAQLSGPYLEDLTPLRVATLAQEAGLLLSERPPLR